MSPKKKNQVNLKTVAHRVGLAPCSVSAVLNDTPASRTIPQTTKDRIFRAASDLNYRPNFWARSLRTKRTRMVAAISQDLGMPAVAQIIAAAQQDLSRRGYLLVLSSISQNNDDQFPVTLQQRGIEGLIAIDVKLPNNCDLPIVVVDLSYMDSSESCDDSVKPWLQRMGAAAADAIVRRIEAAKPAQKAAAGAPISAAQFGATAQGYSAAIETA